MAYTIEGQQVIVLGDTTTHGGKVITASSCHYYQGIQVARVDDLVQCPKCKGTYPIVEGASKVFDHGKAIARNGDKVACGAKLIAKGGDYMSVGVYYAAANNIVSDATYTPVNLLLTMSNWDIIEVDTPKNGCDKIHFFSLYNYFKAMADELDTDVYFIMAQAAEESGWAERMTAPYNLFGQNKPPSQWEKNPNGNGYINTNVAYPSYGACCADWIRRWGNIVKGAKTHDEYLRRLVTNSYNVTPGYTERIKEMHKWVTNRVNKCLNI